MSDRQGSRGTTHGSHEPGPVVAFDQEIDRRGIVQVGVWLAVITVVSFVISVLFYRGLSSYEKRALDLKPSPLREASAPKTPAGPLLQPSPERDLATFRRTEQQRLNGWGWVDKAQNVAHVPVDKAIEAVTASGLPNFSPPAEAETP